MFLSDEGPMLETLDYTIHIGSTSDILYFNLYDHVHLFHLNTTACAFPNLSPIYSCRIENVQLV